jgi:hypothetical protein
MVKWLITGKDVKGSGSDLMEALSPFIWRD